MLFQAWLRWATASLVHFWASGGGEPGREAKRRIDGPTFLYRPSAVGTLRCVVLASLRTGMKFLLQAFWVTSAADRWMPLSVTS